MSVSADDTTKRRTVLQSLGALTAGGALAATGIGAAAASSTPVADSLTEAYIWQHDQVSDSTRSDCADALADAWNKRVNNRKDSWPIHVIDDHGTITYDMLEPHLSDDYGILKATRKWIKATDLSYNSIGEGVISVFLYDTVDTQLEPYKTGGSVGVSNSRGNWAGGDIGMALTFVDRANIPEATTNHEVAHNTMHPDLHAHSFGNYDSASNTTTMGAKDECCAFEVTDVDRHMDFGFTTRHQMRHYLGEQDYDGSDLCSACFR